MNKEIWNEQIRQDILEEIKEYLYLYLFKETKITNVYSSIKKLFNLNDTDILTLKKIHFLLSLQVKDFIEILPQLIRNLTHSTNKEKIKSIGRIQGQINWNKTYKKRFEQGYNDKSLYICNLRQKQYDLPENQLLKYLLKNILEILNTLHIKEKVDIDYWQDTIKNEYIIIKHINKNIHLQNITDISHIPPKILEKTIKNRNNLYQTVAKCYKLYESLFIKNNKQELITLIEKQILKPLNNNQLYEIYIFFNLINNFNNEHLKIGLLHPKNDYTAKIRKNNKTINIYYQHTPNEFKTKSKYNKLNYYYDLQITTKQPDIIIEYEENNKKTYRIIEIKRTKDPNYIRQSIYKVYGYLKDYEEIQLKKQYPAILIIWDGIKIEKEIKNQELIILTRKEFLKYKEKIL
ncbi:MAG: hypothetical protein Q4Q23_01680 [Methanobacteriaceae archaeon]|nr:hypothetical protein [Methanobacteriaceae archaeon]